MPSLEHVAVAGRAPLPTIINEVRAEITKIMNKFPSANKDIQPSHHDFSDNDIIRQCYADKYLYPNFIIPPSGQRFNNITHLIASNLLGADYYWLPHPPNTPPTKEDTKDNTTPSSYSNDSGVVDQVWGTGRACDGDCCVSTFGDQLECQSTPSQIVYKSNDGGVFVIDVESTDTVASLKSKICGKVGTIPMHALTLSHNGIPLRDGTLADNGIGRESDIDFHRGIVGGASKCARCKKKAVSPSSILCGPCGWSHPAINAKGYDADGRIVEDPLNNLTSKVVRVTWTQAITKETMDSDNVPSIKHIQNNALPKIVLINPELSTKKYNESWGKLVARSQKNRDSANAKRVEDRENGEDTNAHLLCYDGCGRRIYVQGTCCMVCTIEKYQIDDSTNPTTLKIDGEETTFSWRSKGQVRYDIELHVPSELPEEKRDELKKKLHRNRGSYSLAINAKRHQIMEAEAAVEVEGLDLIASMDEDENALTNLQKLFFKSAEQCLNEPDFSKTRNNPYSVLGQAFFPDVSKHFRNPKNGTIQAMPTCRIQPDIREKIPQHATGEVYCEVNNETWFRGRVDSLPRHFDKKYPMAGKPFDTIMVGIVDQVSPSYNAIKAFTAFGSETHPHYANSVIPVSYSAVLEIKRDESGQFSTTNPSNITFVRLDCNMEKAVCVPINDPSVIVTNNYVGSVALHNKEGIRKRKADEDERGRAFLENNKDYANNVHYESAAAYVDQNPNSKKGMNKARNAAYKKRKSKAMASASSSSAKPAAASSRTASASSSSMMTYLESTKKKRKSSSASSKAMASASSSSTKPAAASSRTASASSSSTKPVAASSRKKRDTECIYIEYSSDNEATSKPAGLKSPPEDMSKSIVATAATAASRLDSKSQPLSPSKKAARQMNKGEDDKRSSGSSDSDSDYYENE